MIKTLEDCNRANGKTTALDNSFGYWQNESGGNLCFTTTTGPGSVIETYVDGTPVATIGECNQMNGKGTGNDNTEYGYWRVASSGGSCITCHNVHESLFVADAKEPLRRECTTCHTDKLINDMRHPLGAGTPFGESGGNAAVACEICHMPKATSGGFPMHLWRINSSASYSTFPAHADNAAFNAGKKIANTSPDGSYTNAAWVDLDYACGQCHGGDTDHGTKPGLPALQQGHPRGVRGGDPPRFQHQHASHGGDFRVNANRLSRSPSRMPPPMPRRHRQALRSR